MFKTYYAEYEINKMTFIVKVIGEQTKFGREMCTITPKEGKGTTLVNKDSLSKLTTPK